MQEQAPPMNLEEWYDQGQHLRIKELEVFYTQAGRGPHLLCIHGFPTASWDFAPIWATLTQRFSTLAHDLIGLGRSAKPARALPVALQADIIEGLLTQLGIKEAHILAHDLGDTVAQELLARQAEGKALVHWQSCVFLNGGLFPETHRPRLIQKLLISPLGGLVARFTSENTFRKNMVRIFSREHPPSEDFIRDSWQLLTENNGASMLPRLIRYMEERRVNRQRWVGPMVDNIIPLRLINGSQDPVSGKHAAERYQQLVPNADVVLLEDAGHYPHVECPEAVLAAFLAFHNDLEG